MRFPEEGIARELYARLELHIYDGDPLTELQIQGAGVHWDCTLTSNGRRVVTHCFNGVYLLLFGEGERVDFTGRTKDLDLVEAAIIDWTTGHPLETLYHRYGFIDRDKRAFAVLKEELERAAPDLAKVSWEYDIHDGEYFGFEMVHGDRGCSCVSWRDESRRRFSFAWDECRLFEAGHGSIHELGLAIKAWLIDRVQPSTLETQFPWIDIGELARYYERGEPVKGEFLASWDHMEGFYRESMKGYMEIDPVLDLMKDLREKGYDETLRAGQSLSTLMLSRSRRHGLRPEQKFIAISFPEKGMVIEDSKGNEKAYDQVEVVPELLELLDELVRAEID